MFIAYVNQTGYGCDYTIACGKTLWRLKAGNKSDADEEVKHLVLGEFDEEDGRYYEGYWGEIALDSVTIFEVSHENEVPIEKWYKEAKELVASRRKISIEEREKAEFERLKAKFE